MSFYLHWAAQYFTPLCSEDRALIWILWRTPTGVFFPNNKPQHIFMIAEAALSVSPHDHSNYFQVFRGLFWTTFQSWEGTSPHLHINIFFFFFFSLILMCLCLLSQKSIHKILPQKQVASWDGLLHFYCCIIFSSESHIRLCGWFMWQLVSF